MILDSDNENGSDDVVSDVAFSMFVLRHSNADTRVVVWLYNPL